MLKRKKKHLPSSSPPSDVLSGVNSTQGSGYNTSAQGKSIVPPLLTGISVFEHQCGRLTEPAMNTPNNQCTISHPYKTRKNNT